MGDALLLSPVYKVIKDNLEGVKISVLTNKYSTPFVQTIPYVDNIHSIEQVFREGSSRAKKLFRICSFLIKNRFDTIVTRGDKRIPPHRGFDLAAKLCFTKVIPVGSYLEEEVVENRHIVDTYFRILERGGFQIKERGRLYINLPIHSISDANAFLNKRSNKLAGIAPVSNLRVKNWTSEKTAELIKRLKEMSYDVTLFCANKEFSKKVQELTGDDSMTVVGVVDFSLLMGIISLCHIFVGVDTGPTHLAAALGIPAIGLYGPTSGIIASPYSKNSSYIQSTIKCPYYNPIALFSPKENLQECYVKDDCKLTIANCVEQISVEEIIKEIDKLTRSH